MSPAQEEAMRRMRGEIANKLVQIEDIAKRYKVPMPVVTLVMRDPDRPARFTVLSTEGGQQNLQAVADLITSRAGIPVPPETVLPQPVEQLAK